MSSFSARREQLRAWANHDALIFRNFKETAERVTGKPLPDLRVLDLGCGSNAPMTLMLHASGCRVTGADHAIGHRWGLGFRPSRYAAYWREAGLGRTLRKLAGEVAFDSVYYRTLSNATGLRLTESGLDLYSMDVQNPTLPAGEFDVIHSNATWEHVKDVRAANRTVASALRPGGIAYIEIHLFPSLSGGHDLPWITPGRTVLGDVKPWQHLRDRQWQAPVFLNRLREREYRHAFEQTEGLAILEWRTEFTEGEQFLTPEIRAELKDYSAEELTRRSIIVVVQKCAR
jgi:SAM-dependent methyltransferase